MKSEATFCLKGFKKVSLSVRGTHPKKFAPQFLLLIAVTCLVELAKMIGVEGALEQVEKGFQTALRRK